MRPPICEICDERFDPAEGGLVTFAPTPESAAWRARAAEPGFVGHPPDQGWFCATHLEAARTVQALPMPDALRRLAAAPPETAPPAAGPHEAGPHDGTAPTAAVAVACPPVPHDRLHGALCSHAAAFAAALGCSDLPALTTSTQRRWHEMDRCAPPDCPYVDEIVSEAATERLTVRVRRTDAWWNPTELASTSIMLALWEPVGRRTIGTIAAGEHTVEGATATVTGLLVDLPPAAAVQGVVAALLASLRPV